MVVLCGKDIFKMYTTGQRPLDLNQDGKHLAFDDLKKAEHNKSNWFFIFSIRTLYIC